MTRSLLATAFLTLATSLSATAGKFNKVLSPGDPAPAWAGLDGTDGKKHALADLADRDVVVVVFTCNTCPIATDYESRIIAFAAKHAGPGAKVAVVAINPNAGKDESLPEMQKRAAKKKFPFPYLADPTQQVAKRYGATYTPEFFVLNKERKVVYLGAMDDKSPPASATVNHLEAAVAATLKRETPATAETLARGCMVKWKR
ncbi:MAG: thioredoxin family protein [Gemmataceae bacterium]